MSLRGLACASTVSTNRRPKEPVPPVTRMTLPSRSRLVGENRPKGDQATGQESVAHWPLLDAEGSLGYPCQGAVGGDRRQLDRRVEGEHAVETQLVSDDDPREVSGSVRPMEPGMSVDRRVDAQMVLAQSLIEDLVRIDVDAVEAAAVDGESEHDPHDSAHGDHADNGPRRSPAQQGAGPSPHRRDGTGALNERGPGGDFAPATVERKRGTASHRGTV